MADEIFLDPDLKKEDKYLALLPQIDALIDNSGKTANIGNIMAVLKYSLDFWWVGIYEVVGNELRLGIFQGPLACTTIQKGKGVCGTVWEKESTIIVDDVEKFPGHIACSSESKSEIVIPGRNKDGNIAFVLDVDSNELAAFDEIDQKYLGEIVKRIEQFY